MQKHFVADITRLSPWKFSTSFLFELCEGKSLFTSRNYVQLSQMKSYGYRRQNKYARVKWHKYQQSNKINYSTSYSAKAVDVSELKTDSVSITQNDKKKNKSRYISDMTSEQKNELLNETLSAFISVCCHLGFEKKAYQVFNHCISHKSHKHFGPIAIASYNELLKQSALEGNFDEMKQIVEKLKENSIQPNLHTFAYILSSLGQFSKEEHIVQEVVATLQWLQNENISLDDLFSSASFPAKSLKHCLQAIEAVIPNVKQQIPTYNTSLESFHAKNAYHNCLVDGFNDSLFTHKVPSMAEGVLSKEELSTGIKEQTQTELNGYLEIPNIYVTEREAGDKNHSMESKFETMEQEWRAALHSHLTSLKSSMESEFSVGQNNRLSLYPFLFALSENELVNLLIMNIKSYRYVLRSHNRSLSLYADELGEQCYERFVFQYHQKTHFSSLQMRVYEKYCAWYFNPVGEETCYVSRVQWEAIMQRGLEEPACLRDYPPEWPFMIKRAVGRALLNVICTCVEVSPVGKKLSLPAFYKNQEENGVSQFRATITLRKLFKPDSVQHMKKLTLPITSAPMRSPPLPWTSSLVGGYIASGCNLVRHRPHGHQPLMPSTESDAPRLYPVFDSLNQLASVPWMVNGPVFDVVKEVFLGLSQSPKQKPLRRHLQRLLGYSRDSKGHLHHWVLLQHQLSLANFLREKVFWMPFNLEFRGRTYSIPTYLNYYHDDLIRSLLRFARGEKLGPGGLQWVKIHLSNLTGQKKRHSFEERLQYCEDVMEDILDSAHDPLGGRCWWMRSSAPWQTLAACKELVAALESGDPENYVSYLPIHQDASCNIFQHYSALGGDDAGAKSVNLTFSPLPQDLYGDVANLVQEEVRKDAEEGNEIAQRLTSGISRTVIKDVTLAYACGGSFNSVSKKLLKNLHQESQLNESQLLESAEFLANHTISTLGRLFTSAMIIREWLRNIATGICMNHFGNIEWQTPLGLTVSQAYEELPSTHQNGGSRCEVGSSPSSIMDSDSSMSLIFKKQRRSFPPNFIHSLEATHMMLTSIYCQYLGLTFFSLHDAFSTHACRVPEMKKVCREQFVSLHSLPILETLAASLTERFHSHPDFSKLYEMEDEPGEQFSLNQVLANVPPKGTLNLKEILGSDYFFN